MSNKEFMLESGECSVQTLMRECRIKDSLLKDKDILISQKEKTISEIVSASQSDVDKQIEEGVLILQS